MGNPGVDWFYVYVTVGGACYILVYGERLQTANLDISTGPAVKGGIPKVWVGTGGGDLITLSAFNASVLNTVSFGGSVRYVACHGPNLIVAMQDGRLFAIDPETEVVRWSTQMAGAVVWAVETTDVLLVSFLPGSNTPPGATGFGTVVLDAYTGAVLWQVGPIGPSGADSGTFYLTRIAGGFVLEACRATDGSVIWSRTEPTYNYTAVTAVEGSVYATTGLNGYKLYKLDASNGAVTWSAETPALTPTLPTGMVMYAQGDASAPDVVIVTFTAGEPGTPGPGLAAYDAATGSESWLLTLPPGTGSELPIAPAMRYFSGLVALPDEGNVFMVSNTGQILQQWNLGIYSIIGLSYLYLPQPIQIF